MTHKKITVFFLLLLLLVFAPFSFAQVIVNMNPSYDNYVLPSFSNAIPAVPYAYASSTNLKYRFSIANLTTGVTAPDIIQSSNFVTIPSSIHYYGAIYRIKAAAVIDDTVSPFLGNTITVTGASLQPVTLSNVSCGATLATLASMISANPALNAIEYTFRIRLNNSNPHPVYAYSKSPTRFIGANSFAGFPLQYGRSYRMAVQYSYTDAVTNQILQSGYGAECMVYTSSLPLIGLVNPQCGSQLTSFNTIFAGNVGPYATSYQFRIRLFDDNAPNPIYYYSMPNSSRFSTMGIFQGITLAYNTAYSISVQYSVLDGNTTVWSGFGPECKLITPIGGQRIAASQDLKAIAYPNPFTNSFMLDLKTASESLIHLTIYDMLGRMVENKDTNISDVNAITIGGQYPSGVYNIVIKQEDNVKTLRVVKR